MWIVAHWQSIMMHTLHVIHTPPLVISSSFGFKSFQRQFRPHHTIIQVLSSRPTDRQEIGLMQKHVIDQ